MKIQPEDLAVLRAHVGKFDRPEVREVYRNGGFPRSNAVKDLDKRYRWDIFWRISREHREFTDTLWSYMNDDHMDTALRRCVRPLESPTYLEAAWVLAT